VGGAIKQKGIEAPNIEIKVEDCEEYNATLSFYMISGSDLSQVHMVVENLGATGDIPDEGGCDRFMTDGDTSGRRCVGHETSPSTNRHMTMSGDTLDRRCVGHETSPSRNRRMTTSRDTSNRRCVGHKTSPSTNRHMTMSGDTSGRRCVGHETSPTRNRRMTTGRDTSGEGVRTMI
jgi:hypothetical protein